MTAHDILFLMFSGVAILGAGGLIFLRHPMSGAVCFIFTLLSLAGLYVLLSSKFLFAIQIIVYAGAIMSLIIYIIMFLNVRNEDLPSEIISLKRFPLTGIVFAPAVYYIIKLVNMMPDGDVTIIGNGHGGIKHVGQVLFSSWLLPFEIISITLLASLVGSVILVGRK